MIYLDYTANTPADPDVLDAYLAAERRYIANPNSTHIAGQEARAEMERVTLRPGAAGPVVFQLEDVGDDA